MGIKKKPALTLAVSVKNATTFTWPGGASKWTAPPLCIKYRILLFKICHLGGGSVFAINWRIFSSHTPPHSNEKSKILFVDEGMMVMEPLASGNGTSTQGSGTPESLHATQDPWVPPSKLCNSNMGCTPQKIACEPSRGASVKTRRPVRQTW